MSKYADDFDAEINSPDWNDDGVYSSLEIQSDYMPFYEDQEGDSISVRQSNWENDLNLADDPKFVFSAPGVYRLEQDLDAIESSTGFIASGRLLDDGLFTYRTTSVGEYPALSALDSVQSEPVSESPVSRAELSVVDALHSPGKPQRRKAGSKPRLLPDGTDKEVSILMRKKQLQERNRVAAAKCRARKRTRVQGLEDKLRDSRTYNALLRQQQDELREELQKWRAWAMQHHARREDCVCEGMHEYHRLKATDLLDKVGATESSVGLVAPAEIALVA